MHRWLGSPDPFIFSVSPSPREQAGQAKDVKITEYIKKVTIDHVEVLDPTGSAARLDPSKLVVQKRGGFGIGNASSAELALVEGKLAKEKKRVDEWEAEAAR